MTKTNCNKWYGIRHDFDKWEVRESGSLYSSKLLKQTFIQGQKPENLCDGRYMLQHRKCKDCGFIETHYSSFEF